MSTEEEEKVVMVIVTSDGSSQSLITSAGGAREFVDAWTEENGVSKIMIRGSALHADENAVELWFDKNFIVSVAIQEVRQ